MKYIVFALFGIFNLLDNYAQDGNRGVGLTSLKDTLVSNANTYAVIIGISDYKYIKPLSFADQDALLFREFLLSKAGGGVKPENILLLVNKDANASTQPRIRHWLSSTVKPQKGDRVYFYFAGHGDAIDADEYFFLLQDCDPSGDKNNYTGGMASVLQMYNVKTFIKNSLVENGVEVVLIWDACRTNELPGGENGLRKMQEGIAEKTDGESIILSASAGEVAVENNSYAHGHGLFTYYLIDGLSGAADKPEAGGNNDGKVDISELDTWVKMQVRRDAQVKFKTNQNPKFIYNTTETLSVADAGFQQAWDMQKQHGENLALKYKSGEGRGLQKADSLIADLYNRFMEAVKTDSLEGANGAEALYTELKKNTPTTI